MPLLLILPLLYAAFLLGRWSVRKRSHAVRIGFLISGNKGITMNLKVSQSEPFKIVAEDKFENSTGAFDAPPTYSLADPTLGSVIAADDGLSVVVNPSGKLGVTQLQVLGVADGKTISGSADINFIAGDAVTIVLQPGTPVDTVDAASTAPQA